MVRIECPLLLWVPISTRPKVCNSSVCGAGSSIETEVGSGMESDQTGASGKIPFLEIGVGTVGTRLTIDQLSGLSREDVLTLQLEPQHMLIHRLPSHRDPPDQRGGGVCPYQVCP
jgi:hypothetical protein